MDGLMAGFLLAPFRCRKCRLRFYRLAFLGKGSAVLAPSAVPISTPSNGDLNGSWKLGVETWKQWEGQVVDGAFPLHQYLGGDENSAVFLTEQGGQKDRRAAVKLVPARPEHAEVQLSRWRSASKLSHPHLLRLFRVGRCELDHAELIYVVMEYADEDLSLVLPHRPLTTVEAIEMLEPTLSALAYLQKKGWVHGHLKPANIMAVEDRLKISSDALRRIGESDVGSVRQGVYDPPEIAAHVISPPGDVWSLGVMLVETLTQRLPAWSEAEQPEALLPDTLADPFLDIARHCLKPNPLDRWTVKDIATRLQQIAAARNKATTANA
jgi:serine/threonine protein kinase